MRIQNYLFPVFVSANLMAQVDSNLPPPIKFGIAHSTFTSLNFRTEKSNPVLNKEVRSMPKPVRVTEIQYGFAIGFFMWMPLNECVVYKPKIEGSFTNSSVKQPHTIYSTSFDLALSNGFVINLNAPDKNGIIYAARNMTCYLTSKQPYLLVGPKLILKKYDKGYLHKGYENEFIFGFYVGYGINYVFQGKNFAPEISYSLSSTSQNKINDSRKTSHTITIAVNFF